MGFEPESTRSKKVTYVIETINNNEKFPIYNQNAGCRQWITLMGLTFKPTHYKYAKEKTGRACLHVYLNKSEHEIGFRLWKRGTSREVQFYRNQKNGRQEKLRIFIILVCFSEVDADIGALKLRLVFVAAKKFITR